MRNIYRVSISWPSAFRGSGAPDFDTYEAAVQWIHETAGRTGADIAFEIRKLWVRA